ncbi:Protein DETOXIFICATION [Quillaja saponaria]|uniref:Protein DETOXIFICATION n=1 Tax=Quillaja saponaria TaxID=32244 RepID=A0AAD7Q5G0_QUISA|nr:Protein DETOXIFICATION [Quillaja saponaria]
MFLKHCPRLSESSTCTTSSLLLTMDREDQKASLQSPLIQISLGDGLDGVRERNKEKGIERNEIFEEVRKQFWLAAPLMSVTLLQCCFQAISVMFVGHLGELAQYGASMATSLASVNGFSLLLGMASALDTLCGQAYGAKQHRTLGIHMQRAMFVILIVSIPLAIIWANTGRLLIALGQDPEISAEAGQYARFMIPSLFAYGLLQCLNRFLQTQNIVFPMVLCSGVTALVHIFICWILVLKSGLGTRGAALANNISYWLNVLLMALYVKFSSSCANTGTGFSKEALQNILTFLRLAVPSAVMVCMEMWSFEMMVLLAGLLPNPKLETSVLYISLNTTAIVWMIPFGFSNAVSTWVSNELGAGHPRVARLSMCVVLIMAVIEGTLVATVLIFISIWGYAYSNEVEVVRYVAIMMPILAASNFMYGLQCVLSGMARGCGWQKIGAFINLGSYYLVGIPSAVLLDFVWHIGGKGPWLGIICALIVQVSSFFIIARRTDWQQEVKKAGDRVYDSLFPDSVIKGALEARLMLKRREVTAL